MITIPRLELKEFFRRIAGLKENHILPICSYIKLDCNGEAATLTKTTINSFVVHEVKASCDKPMVVLLEQSDLVALVNKSNSETINIEVKGKNVTISDGLNNLKSQTTADQFPRIQQKEDGDMTLLGEEVLEAIGLAATHADKNKNGFPTEYVYVKKDGKRSCVFAGDHFIMYFKEFKNDLPDLQLEVETAAAIGKLRSAEYRRAKNYDVFDSGLTTYGFIAPDAGKLNLIPVMEKTKGAETQFEIDRKELVNFCELSVGVHTGALSPQVVILDNGKQILSRYENIAMDKELNVALTVSNKKKQVDPFAFNPNLLLTVLKSSASEKITFGRIGNTYVVTTSEEKDYIGAIQGLDYSTLQTNKKTETTTA